MPGPDPVSWRELFVAAEDLPQEKLRWWLSDLLDCPLTALPFTACPSPEQHTLFQHAVTRLRAGEPVQYICGRAPFRHLMLKVTPAVLIPRPETEQLVQIALDHILRPGDRVLDVGTGSGCIALSLKQERPDLLVEATDISEDALAVARENAEHNGLDVIFRQADLLQSEAPQSRDVILSNPPYIAETERSGLPKEVREFEPARALFSGPDGTDHIHRLLQQARHVLTPTGTLLLETGETQETVLRHLAKQNGFQLESRNDLAGRSRFRILTFSKDS